MSHYGALYEAVFHSRYLIANYFGTLQIIFGNGYEINAWNLPSAPVKMVSYSIHVIAEYIL